MHPVDFWCLSRDYPHLFTQQQRAVLSTQQTGFIEFDHQVGRPRDDVVETAVGIDANEPERTPEQTASARPRRALWPGLVDGAGAPARPARTPALAQGRSAIGHQPADHVADRGLAA